MNKQEETHTHLHRSNKSRTSPYFLTLFLVFQETCGFNPLSSIISLCSFEEEGVWSEKEATTFQRTRGNTRSSNYIQHNSATASNCQVQNTPTAAGVKGGWGGALNMFLQHYRFQVNWDGLAFGGEEKQEKKKKGAWLRTDQVFSSLCQTPHCQA